MSESILHLIVQGTLVTLVLFSVATCALALVKGVQFGRARRQAAAFRKVRASGLPSAEQLAGIEGAEARLTKTALNSWQESEALAAKHGERFAPSPLLRQMARDGATFYGRFAPRRAA